MFVVSPHQARQTCRRQYLGAKCIFFLCVMWFFGAAYNIWQIVLYALQSFTITTFDNRTVTVLRCMTSPMELAMRNGFVIADYAVSFTLPGVAMLLMFASLTQAMIRSKVPTHSTNDAKRFLVSVLLFVFYFVCQLPAEIVNTTTDSSNSHLAGRLRLQKAVETLSFANGFLNIVVYATCSPEMHSYLQKASSRQRMNIQFEQVPVLVRNNSLEESVTISVDALATSRREEVNGSA
ncbi:hypothetical protein LSAT2_029775 [Lamellibrachia satsuma]|nr:hypothetical protein LSAT2_029775 [Lamellibrachia satsuma]